MKVDLLSEPSSTTGQGMVIRCEDGRRYRMTLKAVDAKARKKLRKTATEIVSTLNDCFPHWTQA